MNKKFLSAILFGALMVTSTGTFVSCKDYDDDIDNINKELGEVKSQITALQTKIDAGKWITSVTPATGGFTVAFSDGSSYTITSGKDGNDGATGEAGAPGTQWTISEDGFWVCDGEKTTVKAVGQDGAKGEDGKDAQPEVEKRADGWYLWNGTEFEKVTVDAPATANVPYYYIEPSDNNYAVMVIYDENGKNEQKIKLPLNEGLAQLAVLNGSYLNVNYTIAGEIKWDGAKAAPAKGDYLITQSFDSLLVQVTPTTYDLAAIKSFSLVNSLNEAAPVTLGAPVAFKQVLNNATRVASEGGLYKLSVTANAITDKEKDIYGDYNTTPYLSLVANEKVRSTYGLRYNLNDCSNNTLTIKFGAEEIWHQGSRIPYYTTKPGEALTIKASQGGEYVYDAYLTVKNTGTQKADSLKWGIETGKTMTIKSNEKASGYMIFVVHYLDVKGTVDSSKEIYVDFSNPSTEETISSIATTPHVATGEANKNFMLVDFAPYFANMSEADRILWNADARINLWNTEVDWEYTDERTGKTITVLDKQGLIQSIEMADAEGKVTNDKSKFAKLKVTFTNNYGVNSGFELAKGNFKARINISGAKEGVNQIVEIPFTIANPTAEEIAKQYTFNPSYFANGTFTIIDAVTANLRSYVTGSINYSGAKVAKADEDYLSVAGSVVSMTAEAEFGTAYGVEGWKVNYLGRQFDIPAFKVKFVNSKSYSADMAKAGVSIVSGGESATVYYAEKAATGKANFFNVKDAFGKFVAATNVTAISVTSENTGLLTATLSGNDITLATTNTKVAVDTPVKVKVTMTVNGETIEGEFIVTVTAFPTVE